MGSGSHLFTAPFSIYDGYSTLDASGLILSLVAIFLAVSRRLEVSSLALLRAASNTPLAPAQVFLHQTVVLGDIVNMSVIKTFGTIEPVI